MKDFDPVTLLAWAPNVLVTHPSVAAKSVQELIALTKKSPGALNYASSGSGSSPHLSDELFKHMTNTDILHVPYKGGGPAVASLLSSETKIGFATMPSVLVQTQSGKLRALAVTSSTRAPALPEVPTVQESGIKNFEVTLWLAVFAPAKTSRPIVERLNREFVAAIAVPQIREALLTQGLQPETTSPAAFSRFLSAEITKWRNVARKANLKPE